MERIIAMRLPQAKLAFLRRLGADWTALATYLDIPPHEWPGTADAAQFIWDWLAMRERLAELPAALREVNRADLAAIVDAALPNERSVAVPARGVLVPARANVDVIDRRPLPRHPPTWRVTGPWIEAVRRYPRRTILVGACVTLVLGAAVYASNQGRGPGVAQYPANCMPTAGDSSHPHVTIDTPAPQAEIPGSSFPVRIAVNLNADEQLWFGVCGWWGYLMRQDNPFATVSGTVERTWYTDGADKNMPYVLCALVVSTAAAGDMARTLAALPPNGQYVTTLPAGVREYHCFPVTYVDP